MEPWLLCALDLSCSSKSHEPLYVPACFQQRLGRGEDLGQRGIAGNGYGIVEPKLPPCKSHGQETELPISDSS